MRALGKDIWHSGGPMLGRTYAFPHHRPDGLTRRQLATVAATFFASLTAALLLAWYYRRQNREDA